VTNKQTAMLRRKRGSHNASSLLHGGFEVREDCLSPSKSDIFHARTPLSRNFLMSIGRLRPQDQQRRFCQFFKGHLSSLGPVEGRCNYVFTHKSAIFPVDTPQSGEIFCYAKRGGVLV
jgi:hypothetical protein